MTDANELKEMLSGFWGSETLYSHALVRSFTYTEGVQAFARHAGGGAYWLLDILALEPEVKAGVKAHGFAVVQLAVDDGTAALTVAQDMDEDTDIGLMFARAIEYTDCPEGVWKFYLALNEAGDSVVITAMLPTEY